MNHLLQASNESHFNKVHVHYISSPIQCITKTCLFKYTENYPTKK